jgi:hypothetical protein
LLLHLNPQPLQHCVFFVYAALAAETRDAKLITSLKAFAGVPLAIRVALASMTDVRALLLGFVLAEAVGDFEGLINAKIEVLEGRVAGSDSAQRLLLERFVLLEHLVVDVGLTVGLEAHDSEWQGGYSMRVWCLVREGMRSCQLGR